MALWKNEDGNDYSKSENDFIDKVLSELKQSEKIMYEDFITRIRNLFIKINKTKCSNCKSRYWNGSDNTLKNGYPNDRGCCIYCAGAKGYFSSEEMFIFDKVKEKYYDNENGFFDPLKMKCSLPRQLRSDTCLAYVCNDYDLWTEAKHMCQILFELKKLQYKRSIVKSEET